MEGGSPRGARDGGRGCNSGRAAPGPSRGSPQLRLPPGVPVYDSDLEVVRIREIHRLIQTKHVELSMVLT